MGLEFVGWVGGGGLTVGENPCVVPARSVLVHGDRWYLSSVGSIG